MQVFFSPHFYAFSLHSFLAGPGAQVWAASNNVETCQPEDLVAGEFDHFVYHFSLVHFLYMMCLSFPVIPWLLSLSQTMMLAFFPERSQRIHEESRRNIQRLEEGGTKRRRYTLPEEEEEMQVS